ERLPEELSTTERRCVELGSIPLQRDWDSFLA
ncbi:hypothetical protein CSUI_009081, partial [Cystoisospora suis]